MEPGQYQLQIFVSLIVILGAAFVALICDFLKGKNEQLRELALELQPPRGERPVERRAARSSALPTLGESIQAEAEDVAKASEMPATRPVNPAAEGKRPPAAEALAAMERGARRANAQRTAPVSNAADPDPIRESIPELPVKLAGVEISAEPTRVVSLPTAAVTVNPEATSGPAAEITTFANEATGAKRDWGALLARAAKVTGRQPEQPEATTLIPAGFHDRYVLDQLVQKRVIVSGVVVSIGVNNAGKTDGANHKGVGQLIRSLIGPRDFACQSSEHEFLVIYPHDRGAAAQRRLNEIAQELWNFQLGSLGTRSIVFSWGGIEVRSETIDEAIASAGERMQENRRGHTLLTMDARPKVALRQAV